MDGIVGAESPAPPARFLDPLRELGDLKRVRSARRDGSIAERLFVQAWGRLIGGAPVDGVWRATTAAALAATRMGDIDAAAMAAVGLSPTAAHDVLARALDEAVAEFDPALRAVLRPGLDAPPAPDVTAPSFVTRLAGQPRAGVTCPGKPRLLLEPPENHAEHCLMVAVYGVLLAPTYGAEPGVVFLASLAHHLHNALIPDSGFAGEVLLGEHLEPAFARATDLALGELPDALADRVRAARRILPDAGTPEGRAFHAADTLDRVLQIEQHLRAGRATMRTVLHDMALVHEGPVKPFQDRLLAAMGLAA
ncbi:HD domain-containing protein [Muricoccus radiodurans]|uniref:HD domain-containing protein n=1 Tax=Muricoccus radiodurans TaxID=2231721 RepID=UPI003CF3DA4F